MEIKITSCLFVLDSEKNENIRKNDIKKIKLLVDKNSHLPEVKFTGNSLKEDIRTKLIEITNNKKFHLEQVYTMEYQKGVEIIYLGITNIENIKDLDDDYQLVDFKIENNDTLIFGENNYKYKTKEIENNNNIEYFHEIDVTEEVLKRTLLNSLICYKKIRSSIDNTDIIFKFLPEKFSLEDVRIIYEQIKDVSVDKSNFRKKIVKYCEEVEEKIQTKNGFRPSKKYKFKPLKGDIWL